MNIDAKIFNKIQHIKRIMDHNKLWKTLTEMGISDHFTCLLRNLYAGQEAKVRISHRTMDCFKMGKYDKAVYCHHAYLAYMQSTSCEMPGWRTNKLLGNKIAEEISITSDMKMTPLLWKKAKKN